MKLVQNKTIAIPADEAVTDFQNTSQALTIKTIKPFSTRLVEPAAFQTIEQALNKVHKR